VYPNELCGFLDVVQAKYFLSAALPFRWLDSVCTAHCAQSLPLRDVKYVDIHTDVSV